MKVIMYQISLDIHQIVIHQKNLQIQLEKARLFRSLQIPEGKTLFSDKEWQGITRDSKELQRKTNKDKEAQGITRDGKELEGMTRNDKELQGFVRF